MFVCIDADGDLICDSIECSVVNLNGLGVVNFEDFAMLGNNWMLAGPGLTGDVNNDEIVDNWDLTEIAEHWLSQCQ